MAPARLLECWFLIPTRRDLDLSDGDLHSIDAWNWLTDELYERFDAYTWAPGLYAGVWKSPKTGRPITDQSRKYIAAMPKKDVARLRQLLSDACQVFHQQCIYLSVAGAVEFIEAPRDGP